MSVVALTAALLALVLASASLFQSIRTRRQMRERGLLRSDADELLYAAWLEELEAKGEEVLARIAAANPDFSTTTPGTNAPEASPQEAGAQTVNPSQTNGVALSSEETPPTAFPEATFATAPDGGDGPAAAEPDLGPAAPEASAPDPDFEQDFEQLDLKSRIRALAREGYTPADIARRLHVSAGEVEVVLELEAKRHR